MFASTNGTGGGGGGGGRMCGAQRGVGGVCVYRQELEMAAVSEIDLIYSKT